jgi:hypothetical protein
MLSELTLDHQAVDKHLTAKRKSFLLAFTERFTNPLVLILLFAGRPYQHSPAMFRAFSGFVPLPAEVMGALALVTIVYLISVYLVKRSFFARYQLS